MHPLKPSSPICVTFGIETDSNSSHSSKAPSPMVVAFGKATEVSDGHFLKAFSSMLIKLGSVRLVIPVYVNASCPIFKTLGIETVVRASQKENASIPIAVTPGIMAEVKTSQYENAPKLMVVTLAGNVIDVRIPFSAVFKP